MPPLASTGRKPPRLTQAGPSFDSRLSSGMPLSGTSQSARAALGSVARPAASMPPSAMARRLRPASNNGLISGLFTISAPQLAFSLTSVRSARGLLDGQGPWSLCYVMLCYVITSYPRCTGNRSSDLLRVGRRRDTGGLVLLLHLVRIVQAVRAFELDGLQIESGHGALDLLRLIEQAVHDLLHGRVAHLIPLADHLVVGLDHDAAAVELAHGVHGELDLGPHRVIDLRRLRLDQVRHARALHHRAVNASIAADIDVADAERVEIVRGESVVGEAIMLLLGIVDHQPELHALAGKLAIRETAEPGEDRGEAVLDGLARLAAGGPLRCHPGKVVDQQIGGGVEILRAAVAMAASAFLDVVVARRAIAVAWSGTVQVLAP